MPCIPSVLSVLSVVKFSSCPGCGFANAQSTGRSFCGFAAWRELLRSFWQRTNACAAWWALSRGRASLRSLRKLTQSRKAAKGTQKRMGIICSNDRHSPRGCDFILFVWLYVPVVCFSDLCVLCDLCGETYLVFFVSFVTFCSNVLVFAEGGRKSQTDVEHDCPRKGKDTETESQPAPTGLDVTSSRTAPSTPCIASVFSVLSVVKFSSCPGCGFANGESSGRSFCGLA